MSKNLDLESTLSGNLSRNYISTTKQKSKPKKTKHRKLKMFFGCFLVLAISMSLLFFAGVSEEQQQTTIKTIKNQNFGLNQNFKISNYADGVKITNFYIKDLTIYAELDDTSSYYCFHLSEIENSDNLTLKQLKELILMLNQKYSYKFLEYFLKNFDKKIIVQK